MNEEKYELLSEFLDLFGKVGCEISKRYGFNGHSLTPLINYLKENEPQSPKLKTLEDIRNLRNNIAFGHGQYQKVDCKKIKEYINFLNDLL